MKNLNEVVKYNTDGGLVELDFNIIRNVIAVGNNITDSEVIQFMQLCKYRKLNPFLKQVHLVKFKDKAEIIVGVDTFTQRLNAQSTCLGWESGVICVNEKNEIIERVGTFHLPSEKLVAAYCTIEREGWKKPFKWTVNLSDYYRTFYNRNTKKEEAMGQWKTMPAVMLTKCAIVSCVRKVYSEEFGGMYSAEEMGVENNVIDAKFTEVSESNNEKIKELTKPLTTEQIKTLKEIAKTSKASYDSEKMVCYVLEQINIHNGTNSKKIEELQNQYFELAFTKIKETKQAAENKAKKEKESIKKEAESKNKDNKSKKANKENGNKEKKEEVETDLPIPDIDENTAKPANTKKDKKEVDDKKLKDENKK